MRWRGTALLAIVLSGCSSARLRIAPLPTLSFGVDSSFAEAIAPGVVHRTIRSSEGPWAIEVLDVRLDRCTALRAVKGFPGAVGRKTTTAMLTALDDTMRVLGGVNADFFRFDPAGSADQCTGDRRSSLHRPLPTTGAGGRLEWTCPNCRVQRA